VSVERLLTSGLQVLEPDSYAHGLHLQPPLTWSILACLPESPDGSTIRSVFSFCTLAGTVLSGFNLMALNSKLHFYARIAYGRYGAWKIISAADNVTAGKWYHFAGRIYVTGEAPDFVFYMEFWIDGISQGTLSWGGDPLLYASTSVCLHIGAYGGQFLHCIASDFAIWAAELSDAEIFQLAGSRRANLPLMIQPASLKGHWRYDELNDGKSVYDAIANDGFYGFHNYSAGTGGDFAPAGTGDAYGRLAMCPHDTGVQVVSFETPSAAPSFRGLALCGAGK